jgi:hypothetical protein
LDLLGFIRPNWDFSMGYGEEKQKNPLSVRLSADRRARRGFDPASGKRIARISDFGKELR